MARQGDRRDQTAREAFFKAARQMHPQTLRASVLILSTVIAAVDRGASFAEALGEAATTNVAETYGDNWRRKGDPAPGTIPQACAEPGPLNDHCGLLRGHAGSHIGHSQGLQWRDAEEAREIVLYGPPGARWGDLAKPCPFVGPVGPCALRLNHSGPHLDGNGDPMPVAMHTITDEAAGLVGMVFEVEYTPGHEGGAYRTRVLPDDACTCGHPEAHIPPCPRAARASGTPEGGTEP